MFATAIMQSATASNLEPWTGDHWYKKHKSTAFYENEIETN